MNKIIAIVGMCGSGKSIASDYLEKQGYAKVYFGGVTMQKLKEQGIEINPQTEKMMREKLRRDLGMGAYAKILLPEIKSLSQTGNVVLNGVYSWDEVIELNKELTNLTIIGIVTDKHIRYQRLSIREIRPLTNVEAQTRDIAEIENSAKGGPIVYADYYIFNNGTLEEYYKRLDEILNEVDKNEKND